MECTRGVYCVDLEIRGRPISVRSKAERFVKTFVKIPMALDDNLDPVDKDFLKRYISQKVINSHAVDYSIRNKKFLSGLCYRI